MTLQAVFERREARRTLIEVLAKLRNYNRSSVEAFLLSNDEQDLLEEVLATPSVDSLGTLMYNSMETFIQWILISQSDDAIYMKRWLIDLLEQGVQCKKISAGLRVVVKKLVDLQMGV